MELQSHGQNHPNTTVLINKTIAVPDTIAPERNDDLFTANNDSNALFKLNYQLLSLLTYQKDSDSYQNIYSISVNKIDNDNNVESDFLHDISRDENKAIDLYNLLLRNTVSPITLREIAEEHLPI